VWRAPVLWSTRMLGRFHAPDNYLLVLLLIVLSILVIAVTDVAPVGRIVALVLVGGTLF
jgi:hypothetical protein